jgi:hypothetical protein
MNAAQIDGESAVDEYPQVVISGKREDLAACVGKLSMQLGGEMKLCVCPL